MHTLVLRQGCKKVRDGIFIFANSAYTRTVAEKDSAMLQSMPTSITINASFTI
jgi:hypothetical protein